MSVLKMSEDIMSEVKLSEVNISKQKHVTGPVAGEILVMVFRLNY